MMKDATKICTRCQQELALTLFYKGPSKEGKQAWCKECFKKYVKTWKADNPERVRLLASKSRRKPRRKEKQYKVHKEYRERNKDKIKVRSITTRAINSGKLKPLPCERCGEERSQAHHEDYSKPLDVTWLCQLCHAQRHKEIVESAGS